MVLEPLKPWTRRFWLLVFGCSDAPFGADAHQLSVDNIVNVSCITCVRLRIQGFGLDLSTFSQQIVAADFFHVPVPQGDRGPIVHPKQLFRDCSKSLDKSGHVSLFEHSSLELLAWTAALPSAGIV